jgi:hypothetical protein
MQATKKTQCSRAKCGEAVLHLGISCSGVGNQVMMESRIFLHLN